jgi:hypothetical protein
VRLKKVNQPLVIYRYHNECATFSVSESTIWDMRIREIEAKVLNALPAFTIWNAGKQGKKFFRLGEHIRFLAMKPLLLVDHYLWLISPRLLQCATSTKRNSVGNASKRLIAKGEK